MHRRRLVLAARDRLEVVNRKSVGIEVTVPAHHIERVVVERVAAHVVGSFQPHLDGPACHLELVRAAEIALAVRGHLGQLPVARPVAIRDVDEPADLQTEHA